MVHTSITGLSAAKAPKEAVRPTASSVALAIDFSFMLGLSRRLCCAGVGGRRSPATACVLPPGLSRIVCVWPVARRVVGKALRPRRSQSNTSEIPEQYQCETFYRCCTAVTSKMQQITDGIDTKMLKISHVLTQVMISQCVIFKRFYGVKARIWRIDMPARWPLRCHQ